MTPFKEPPKSPEVRVIRLTEGQYCPIPNSDKTVLFGPGKLQVTRFPNGALDGQVVSGKTGELFVAITAGMQRVSW